MDEQTEIQAPQGTVFTLKVPLDRNNEKTATFYLRELDEETYLAFKTLISSNKPFDATRMMVKSLSLKGSDDVSTLKNNFVAVNAAGVQLVELIAPLDAELKKN